MADTVDLRVGRDFDIVFLSLNPEETHAQALEKESQIVRNLEDQTIRDGWHFLTGDLENIRKVTDSMGFKWAYRPEENVLNHPTGSVTLTPNGKIVGYSIGNDLPTIFFRKNLEFARRDEVGPPADQSRMFGCIRIPASASKYRGTIELALKITGVVFVLVTVGLISFLTIKYRQPSLPSGRVTGA
jgi:protein SCO1/2